MIKVCKNKFCGKTFETKNERKVYCCNKCAMAYNYYTKKEEIREKRTKPRIEKVAKRTKANKTIFNFIMNLSGLTNLSYGKLMQYYPDLNKIKSFIDYQQIIGNAKNSNLVDDIFINHAKKMNLSFNQGR